MLIVQKFGGSSLAGIERLRMSAGLVMAARGAGHDVVVVVSAMGDTTDELIDMAQKISPSPSAREMAALTTTGEQQSAALMAIMLESLGAKARSLTGWQSGILTDCDYSAGTIQLVAPARISEALNRGHIAVVTGFQGVCPAGDITSLGRGGSDTTAVALAVALEAGRCEIYTDVSGIYTADPRIVPEAVRLPCIDFRDMLALAERGSQVLHPASVALAMANSVPIHLASAFEKAPGSVVCSLADCERPDYAGVTRNLSAGEVSLAGRAADAGTLSKLVLLLGAAGLPVLSGSIGENCVSVTVPPEALTHAMALIHREMILKKP